MAARKDDRLAAKQNEAGIAFYENWELEKAIAAFQAAILGDPDSPEFPLNMARAYARSGDFGKALQALGAYLHNETKDEIATRYEQLFSSSLDEVERVLTDTMPQMALSLPQIGKALQMWLEYRIVVGRRPLRLRQPSLWAAAITYAIVKTNMLTLGRAEVAALYGVKEQALQNKYQKLVDSLDLIAADYRYFVGEENPLDKVVSAGETEQARDLFAELERRFENGNKRTQTRQIR